MGSHYRVRAFSTYMTCPYDLCLGAAKEESVKRSRLSIKKEVRRNRSVLPCQLWKLASQRRLGMT